jgi:hypothetical protein
MKTVLTSMVCLVGHAVQGILKQPPSRGLTPEPDEAEYEDHNPAG